MELLLGGILNKKEQLKNSLTKASSRYYMGLMALVAVSFLLGRVLLLDAMFPCGIGLISALASRGRANIYLLPFIILGTLTYYGTSYDVWGDTIAAIVCGTMFFILAKRKLSIMYVSLLAGGITIAANAALLIGKSYFIPYDAALILTEGVMVACLTSLFNMFFCVKEKKQRERNTVAQGVVAMAVVSVLVVGGMETSSVFNFSLIYLVSLFIPLFVGYKMGIMEGALAGIATGFTAVIIGLISPAVIGILACGGMVAGFFVGLSRVVAGTVFSAVCIGFGLIKGYPELYMPVINPLIASAIFILMPKGIMDSMELGFARLRRDENYYDLVSRETSKKILKEYADSFDKISGLQNGEGDTNTMIQMQFKAMSKLAKSMMDDLDNPMSFFQTKPYKYGMKVGVSTYAKENNVCGDSYLCTEFQKGKYMLALSDGMGKGLRASEESTMTITGLYHLMKAGFDINLALKTMNTLLLTKSPEEIFSTVDMGLFDRISGKIQLYKIGAAATFIKRGSTVEAIKVANLPIGMVNKISVDYIEVQAKKGDKIILVSDGVTEADYEEGGAVWLKEAVESIKSNDPQTISDLIINKAVEKYGIREKDDMTVITALIM